MNNLITDIDGLTVGNSSDLSLKSGTTVLLCETPMICSYAVVGGAPGTRDTDLLMPEQLVQGIDALVLSGGSAFGLDACGGVQSWLRQHKRGYEIGPVQIPIVPGAILFDLINGGDKDWGLHSPYRDLGFIAADSASDIFNLGTHGAGTGATTAGLKGGLGSASIKTSFGATVGALVAVNPLGSVTMGDVAHFWASPFEIGDEFGGLGLPSAKPSNCDVPKTKRDPVSQANTTIAVIATDAKLTKSEARRLAIAAHDGFARAIYPSHTPLDGDLIFSLSSEKIHLKDPVSDQIELGALAANAMARAIARGVFEAESVKGDHFPTWKDRHQHR
ncbi:MAG: P1 family peptidase [Cohaesibacteraceae bacterium]|nr:P1 family peptidase [Cohaesibacteraceae bacterium]MBL4876217.1 P1 family peptidase [Cohaesibacteraceae bacterium]